MTDFEKLLNHECKAFIENQAQGEWDDEAINEDTQKLVLFVTQYLNDFKDKVKLAIDEDMARQEKNGSIEYRGLRRAITVLERKDLL